MSDALSSTLSVMLKQIVNGRLKLIRVWMEEDIGVFVCFVTYSELRPS
jgi:hypothetical protein